MNCPKCQKPLPKSNPRVCPNCKMDLTNFYKLKSKQGEEIQIDQKKPLGRILLIAGLACVLVAALLFLILHFGGNTAETTEPTEAVPASLDMEAVQAEINSKQVSDFAESAEATDYVKLTVADFGEIVVRLRPDIAPLPAQNFKDLVARHYYDGLIFLRVYPGFMIQGGAGSEALVPIKGEFSANGWDNPLLHVRGVLSMARTNDMNSATSQFFLMHADYPSLNGNYAAFGYVVAGLETVDKICEIPLGDDARGEHSVPQVDVIIESAVFVKPN